jgi:hypothetical protein
MPETSETSNPFNVEYPAGKFFVGREYQLRQLHELLNSVSLGTPSNLIVIGKGGEGKTSYLEKIVEESRKKDMLAFREPLDVGKPAETNIDTVMRALLRELGQCTPEKGLEDDWKSGKKSTYRTPRLNEVRSADLALDFERIYKILSNAGKKGCVICIDEGQRIHPLALSAFKNSLQSVRLGYMIVLSLLNDPDVTGAIGDVDNDKAGRNILNDLAGRSGDPGASRFFQNAAPLGPFDTRKEAEECIKKRLENNIIKFTKPVITLITQIMGRQPREMVRLAHRVYGLAQNPSLAEIGEKNVHDAFLKEYRQLNREVDELRENLSSLPTKIYRELAKSVVGMTAMDITKKMYPTLENEVFARFSTSVQAELDRLCQRSVSTSVQTELDRRCHTKFCKKLDGEVYYIAEPEFAYALKLTLGEP